MARVNQNIDFAGPEVLLNKALRLARDGHLTEAIFWAASVAQKGGDAAFFDANALAAALLTHAGKQEAAEYYWDKIIKSAPHKLEWLEPALKLAISHNPDGEYAQKWLAIFRNIYLNSPSPAFMEYLERCHLAHNGSAGIHKGYVQGWCWLPAGTVPSLAMKDNPPKFNIELKVKGRAADHVLYEFKQKLPESDHNWQIAITLQDRSQLHGSPLNCSPVRKIKSGKQGKGQIAILIPVYDDARATLGTLGALFASLKFSKLNPQIYVAWDQGPDDNLLAKLRRLTARKKIRLIENPVNMGFLASVNNAIRKIGSSHIVLLNADTIVHGDWLDRLCACADLSDTGTVTALGNEAELMSYPTFRDRSKVRSLREVALLDAAAKTLPKGESLQEIPVGVGFCMLITRQALASAGTLDGYGLCRGYGEEVEFCLRAAEKGLKNYGAYNVFVGHLGERSFGASKKALAAQNNMAIHERFPDYQKNYELFLHQETPKKLRRKLALATIPLLDPLPVLEIRTWNERILPPWIKDEQHEPSKKGAALFVKPSCHKALLRIWGNLPVMELEFSLPIQQDELAEAVRKLPVDKVLARHINDKARKLIADLGLPDNTPPLPSAKPLPIWDGSGGRFLLSPPISLGGFKLLKQIAISNPEKLFYVFHIETLWQDAPKPPNILEMPRMHDYAALEPDFFLMIDNVDDAAAWREWLASHNAASLEIKKLADSHV